ncbi:MAG: CPBP family intramembrane glutamic endopeptidase [Cyanobacteria bacterium J06649_4]
MAKRFIENGREGDSDLWIYVVVMGITWLYWFLFAYLFMLISSGLLSLLPLSQVVVETVSNNVPFAMVLGWFAWVMPNMHGRPLQSLINTEKTINFRRVAQGLGLWMALSSLWLGLDVWMDPQNYRWQFDPSAWYPLAALSILLVPIQTSIEELIFRGYLMQGLRLITRHSAWLVVISSFIFSWLHWGNPEMLRGPMVWGALNYFAWGVIFSVITLKDNGLELALGVHAGNNIFLSLMVTTPDSVLQTPALFSYTAPIDPRQSLVFLLFDGIVFYWAFFGGMPRRNSKSLFRQSMTPPSEKHTPDEDNSPT